MPFYHWDGAATTLLVLLQCLPLPLRWRCYSPAGERLAQFPFEMLLITLGHLFCSSLGTLQQSSHFLLRFPMCQCHHTSSGDSLSICCLCIGYPEHVCVGNSSFPALIWTSNFTGAHALVVLYVWCSKQELSTKNCSVFCSVLQYRVDYHKRKSPLWNTSWSPLLEYEETSSSCCWWCLLLVRGKNWRILLVTYQKRSYAPTTFCLSYFLKAMPYLLNFLRPYQRIGRKYVFSISWFLSRSPSCLGLGFRFSWYWLFRFDVRTNFEKTTIHLPTHH